MGFRILVISLLSLFSQSTLFSQSGLDIEVLTPDVCVPGKVTVRVINCSSCISYEWEVNAGTGFKSAGSEYSTIISDTGWLDVAVKLRTSAGAILLLGKKKAVYGRRSPKPVFTVDKPVICHGSDSITLTDLTPNIKTRDWLIDGKVYYDGPKQLKMPSPANAGYKSVYLLVRDSWDCKGTILKDSAIAVWDSIRLYVKASKNTGCAPANINYTFTADTFQQRIKSVTWSFEKGIPASSTLRAPKGIFYSKGDTFDARLTVNTDKGCVYKVLKNNFLSLGDTSVFSISFNKLNYCANELVSARVLNSMGSLPVWQIKNQIIQPDSLIGKKVTFRFKDTGVPVITVRVNNMGCISEATYDSVIIIYGPVAKFSTENQFYCSVPKNLVFNNESVEFSGGTNWHWKLINMAGTELASSKSKNFNYNTTIGSSYRVSLKAVGANGCVDSIMMDPAVSFGHIDSNFKVIPNPICPGKTVNVIPLAGVGPKNNPNNYKWSFYDKNNKIIYKDNKVQSSYTFNSPGKYSVKMLVSNNDNCRDSLLLVDTINVYAPVVNIEVSDTLLCSNQVFKAKANFVSKRGREFCKWSLYSIDSFSSDSYGYGDSVFFRPNKTGRYRLVFEIIDTSKNGCYNSIVYPNLIKVSGLRVLIVADKNFGCAPLKMNLKSKLIYNVNYINSDTNLGYFWSVSNQSKVILNSINGVSNTATLLGKSNEWIRLKYTNGAGCVDSSGLNISTNLGADFRISDNAHCIGQIGQISDYTPGWGTSIRYDADSSIIFIPSNMVSNPRIKFTKSGYFPIRQIVSYQGCSDTAYQGVYIDEIKADFTTPDSISFCAPRLINFFNNTKGAVYNYWKFGDGDSAKTLFNDIAGHLYLKNNSNPGYDVQLISVNQYGCRDTLLKKKYLRIIGPVPDFNLTNIKGCEPLPVVFTNNSRDYNRMFVDYDNGVVLDSNILGTYWYKVTDKALPVQVFKPKVLLYDSFGCSALGYAKDSITVLKNAEAQHVFSSIYFLRNTEGCTNNLLVKFSNKSRFYIKTFWDFNDDGKIDIQNQNNPSYFYDKPGVYHPVIIAENINGCRDTFRRDSIVVWQHPIANYKSSADTTCAINPVTFWSTTVFSNKAKSYLWNFGELPIYNDTSTKSSAVWKYKTPFSHAVSLKVEDIKGCKDEIIKNLEVNDTAGPLAPQLAYITVRNDSYVDYYWRQSKLGNFLKYHTYLDSLGYYERYSSFNRKDTFFSANYGSQVYNRRFCFTTLIEDTCTQMGSPAVGHCTMVLRDTSYEPFNIRLSWLAYDWWNNELSHYEVFRKDPGSSVFNKIADVKSNRLTYTDSFLCDKSYCYYVEAVHKNREYRSRSNSVCKKPIYLRPDSFVNTTLVTVLNNAFISAEWQPYYRYYRNFDYVLERSSNGLPGSFSKVLATKNTWGDDYQADYQNRTNYYRVKFRDHCGVESDPGVVSNSIWLRFSSQARTSTRLNWTPYEYWHSGVRNYGVEIRNNTGDFVTFRTTSASVHSVDSINIESFNLDSICFRVYAVKDTVTLDTSWSNEICLVPSSYVHVPTAFTPDRNNLNEVFKPVSGFIHRNSENPNEQYVFKIYNRWGQLVFESNEPAKGWDGRLNGKDCPAELYVWTLKALGYDGVPHRMEGTVYLMR